MAITSFRVIAVVWARGCFKEQWEREREGEKGGKEEVDDGSKSSEHT